MAMKHSNGFSRRDLFRMSLAATGALAATGSFLFGGSSRAGSAGVARRFVQINLTGGWDSAYATDPIVGSKRESPVYDPSHLLEALMPKAVDVKPTLVMGPGMIPAENAFARMPTAFVNGMFMEVSSHDFATQYMSSGHLSLSNTRDYPAIPALLGADSAIFPPHVVVGLPIPLGVTRDTAPPLYTQGIDALDRIIGRPGSAEIAPGELLDHFTEQQVEDANALIEALDKNVYDRLPRSHRNALANWRSSSSRIEEIYQLGLAGTLVPTPDDEARYGAPGGVNDLGPARMLASLYRLMVSNLCPYITTNFSSFDTHSNQLAVHLPLMQQFAAALDVFVTDLLETEDPAAPGYSLAETTTLFITSEFVRTPMFSTTGGTEHWQSASAILMGRGVQDGAVIGATNDNAEAIGWDPEGGGPGSEPLLPAHLIATILANVGTEAHADTVSTTRIAGLFEEA